MFHLGLITPLKLNVADSQYRFGVCECESRKATFGANGRLETCNTDERAIILTMFSRYFNYHSSIPDRYGTFTSSQAIYQKYATEM